MSCRYKEECPSYSGWCEGPKQDFSRCVEFLITAYENEKHKKMNETGNIIYDHVQSIVRKNRDIFYKLLLDCLKPYGITEENMTEYIGRLECEMENPVYYDGCSIVNLNYFLDKKCIFTVCETQRFREDRIEYSFEVI